MHPELALDTAILAENARAWRAFANAPLYAVVKGNAYGWGLERVVAALEAHVDAFCVADEEELAALRRVTRVRAIVFASVPPDRLERVLAADALPTITSREELAVAERGARARALEVRVRLGVRPAIAWSGNSLDELRALAPHLAAAGASVELWTHVTDFAARAKQRDEVRTARRLLVDAGVRVISTDIASSLPLAADGADGCAVRVGVGLFGATGGARVPGVRCALRVVAPIVRVERLADDAAAGYGRTRVPAGTEVVVARCGYAEGLPRELGDGDDILSIGMQYVTARASRANAARDAVVFLDGDADLDEFASRARRSPHEIVTAFGNAAHARA